MPTISFSFFLNGFKNSHKKRLNQQNIINSLFDEIILYSEKDGAEPYCISKQRASGMFKGTEKVPQYIINASYNDEYILNINSFFDELIRKEIDSNKLQAFISSIIETLPSDDSIPEVTRSKIEASYAQNSYSEILVEVFLYTLRCDSDNDTIYKKPTKTQSQKKIPIKNDIDVKTETSDMNLPYIKALYEVYSERENSIITKIDEANNANQKHFSRQREAYFDAECVYRKSRDTYKNYEPFEELKSEMFDGIIETYENDYNSGYNRLQSVLTHAAEVKFDSSVLCHETEWIKQSVKKGLCHYLVNDEKIKSWVNIDE